MPSHAAVTTTFSPIFRSVVPLDAALTAMPAGWDIGGGDSAGWGRGVTGVCWIESLGGVLFSDTAHKRRLAWVPGSDPQLAARTPGAITGTAIDRAGRLIGCDWSGHRIIAEHNGETTVLAADCAGTGFNRPYDVCLGRGDDLLFVDQKIPFPPTNPAQASGRGGEALLQQQVKAFGGGSGLPASDRSGVYRIAGGTAEDTGIMLAYPGGLAFDAPRDRLLVSEPRAQRIHSYPVRADGSVDAAAGTVLAVLEGSGKGAPHGLAIDAAGNIFTGGPGGVWVLSHDGQPLGVIHLTASRVTSLAIGGGRLFIATPVGLGVLDLVPGAAAAETPPAAPAILRQPLGLDQSIERHDPALDRIIPVDAVIANHGCGGFFEDLGGGEHEIYSRSLEGTYWDSREQCLMFSDIGNARRMRLTVETGAITVAHEQTDHTNGATLDAGGNVLSCEHKQRRISRRLANGERVTVVDRTAAGGRLNHPNDIVIRSDGNIYFTDPWWDFGAGETCETDGTTTRHLTPDGRLSSIANNWAVCNGLALSVDEQVLYINDTIRKHIRAFDLAADGTVDLASDRIFCELQGPGEGKPDGMKLDMAGNVWCGGPGGLWVFSPAGKHLGTVRHGTTQTNNLAFGGTDWKTLFFCSWITLHSIPVLIPGVPTIDAPRPKF